MDDATELGQHPASLVDDIAERVLECGLGHVRVDANVGAGFHERDAGLGLERDAAVLRMETSMTLTSSRMASFARVCRGLA